MPARANNDNLRRVVWLVVPISLVAGAGLLRFYGLTWSLPNEVHSYTYHPDEFLVIGASLGRVLAKRTIDPGFYNYPSLYIYLSAAAIAAAFAYGAAGSLAAAYSAARAVAAASGTIAVAVTYWAASAGFGRAAGALAALVLCIAPIHAQHSHFATVDVTSTLFVAGCLGFANLVLREGRRKDYLLAGVMAGLAAGTKYNAGLVLAAVVAAHFLRGGGLRTVRSSHLWAAVMCAGAAFLLTTPGVLVNTRGFFYGFTYELRHAAQGHGLVFVDAGNGFLYTIVSSLWYGLGPLTLVAVPAVLYGLWRRDKRVLAILAFFIPYYVLISISQVRFARYALPLFPAIAILSGWFVSELWRVSSLRLSKALLATSFGLLVGWTLVVTLAWTRLFGAPDPRDGALNWIRRSIPKGACVGVIDVPWYYSPPLSKDLGFGTLEMRSQAMLNTPYNLVSIPVYEERECQWTVVSDYETRDPIRLKRCRTVPEELRRKVSRVNAQLETLRNYYVERASFGGLSVFARLGFPDPPHDMRYVRPLIKIYERKR